MATQQLTTKLTSQIDAIIANYNQAVIESRKAAKMLDKARESARLAGYRYFYNTQLSRPYEEENDLKRFVWLGILQLTGIVTLMDSQTERAMWKDLSENPLEVTKSNILSVLQDLYERKDEILANSLINVFRSLNRNHKGNAAQRTKLSGKRLIIDICSPYYGSDTQAAKLTDLDRILHFLDGKTMTTDHRETLGYKAVYSKDTEIESDYLKVRLFKNGSAHIYFKRKDLIDQCNRLIAYHHEKQLGFPA